MTKSGAKTRDVLLETKALSVAFGGLRALHHFQFHIAECEIVGLIGPNGAGKTTVFNALTGMAPVQEGLLLFRGKNVTHARAYELAQMGIRRTFQNIRLFSSLTVLENVMLGLGSERPYHWYDAALRTRAFESAEVSARNQALEILSVFQLDGVTGLRAHELPYGSQRRLEMARALIGKPSVILLDEPAAGLNQGEKAGLIKLLSEIRHHYGVALLVIEHDMKLIMQVCERILVLDQGELICEGTPDQVQHDARVRVAYLGAAQHG